MQDVFKYINVNLKHCKLLGFEHERVLYRKIFFFFFATSNNIEMP